MPKIFDNMEHRLADELVVALTAARRTDVCIGYFNLRGWRLLADGVDGFAGGEDCARILVGMQVTPREEAQMSLRVVEGDDGPQRSDMPRRRREAAELFREQLVRFGAPTNADEAILQQLARQLRGGKVIVRLFLRHPLHAKLYLVHRNDHHAPVIGYVGSSNLTQAGLAGNGELNVDVVDQDASGKLARWFEDRWSDTFCLDISDDLAEVIETSWARETPVSPYHIYLKMAWHLSEEARKGLIEFEVPDIELAKKLFPFQERAVRIAARHVHQRGGVLLGDVVGLGKTLTAVALARTLADELPRCVIVCPRNLTSMWEDHVTRYALSARVVPFSRLEAGLGALRDRTHLVIVDESHNLRNSEGVRYRQLREFIARNDSRCVLLSATPFNRSTDDLAAQLQLFVPEDRDLGVRPERLLQTAGGEASFLAQYQCNVRSLAAFKHSPFMDDWRDLMRQFLVRRTRSFVAQELPVDPSCGRPYLTASDGDRLYFPMRVPRTVAFEIDDADPADQYGQLYSPKVVAAINQLQLPRYGLANYVAPLPVPAATPEEARLLARLTRAGQRLMGFCRTNLFKRLESSGFAFLQSVERHALRNHVFLYALEHGLDLPLGPQDAALLDEGVTDADPDDLFAADEDGSAEAVPVTLAAIETKARAVYDWFARHQRRRFQWLPARFFVATLAADLRADADLLQGLLDATGPWVADRDAKLRALEALSKSQHPQEKILVFSQFADTVHYLAAQLEARGVQGLAAVTGASTNPTDLAWRFSPRSNEKVEYARQHGEIRVLVATDVLSEGQNLQDSAIVVNFDLPWAIIRLIQRAGRVDRIGQASAEVLCYSFLPAAGVERIINLRGRVRARLRQNEDVVGSDEQFFEGDVANRGLQDLYAGRAGVLDDADDREVDLASYAYEIWRQATEQDPGLVAQVEALDDVAWSTRPHLPTSVHPEGVLVYLKGAGGNDALAYLDHQGRSITESQFEILKRAECAPETPAVPRDERHHETVRHSIAHVAERERVSAAGQLGRRGSVRRRLYESLDRLFHRHRDTLFQRTELPPILDVLLKRPLLEHAKEVVGHRLKARATDDQLADLAVLLHSDGRLCVAAHEVANGEPHIVCSLGLRAP